MSNRKSNMDYSPGSEDLVPGTDATRKLNSMALLGFVLAFFISIGGVAVSVAALVQIGKTGERGKGLAIAGIVIGAVSILLTIIAIIARQ